MKFKLLIWLSALLLTLWVCSCSTRKKNSELSIDKSSSQSEIKLDIKESLTDKGNVQKFSNEKYTTVKVLKYFGHLTDTSNLSAKHPIWEEITYSNGEKSSTESEQKDLTQNKALQAKQKEKQADLSKDKNKSTEVKGFGFGKVFAVALMVAITLIAIYYIWKQKKVKSVIQ